MRLLLFSFLLFGTINASCQAKVVDFYYLLNKLIPKEGLKEGNWNVQNDPMMEIIWQDSKPRKNIVEYIKNGTVKISFKNKKLTCENKICKWGIGLSGKTNTGYNEIQISDYPDERVKPDLLSLIGSEHKNEFIIIKKDDENSTIGYEVILPGKTTAYIICSTYYDNGMGYALSFIILFDKAEFIKRMQ